MIKKENISVTIIEIKTSEIDDFSKQLTEVKKGSYPQAVILNLNIQTKFSSTDLAVFIELLTQNDNIVIGIQSTNQELINYANISGIVVFPIVQDIEKIQDKQDKEVIKDDAELKTTITKEKISAEETTKTPIKNKDTKVNETKTVNNDAIVENKKEDSNLNNQAVIEDSFKNTTSPLVIDYLIAKKEQIYSKEKDLIVGNKVEVGAELISDANVFIYDLMQGSVFAGVKGNKKAVIFIHNFEATLISIAGVYKKFETIPENLKNKSVNITLSNDKLHFKIN